MRALPHPPARSYGECMRFTTTILLDGRNTGIPVPEEVVLSFGAGKRVPVVVRLGGHEYRSTVSFYRGRFLISLSSEHRAAAGVEGGDTVEVELEHDTAPRIVEPTDDLAAALAERPDALAAWERLSPSARKAHIAQIEGAKAAETRARRVEKVVATLLGA